MIAKRSITMAIETMTKILFIYAQRPALSIIAEATGPWALEPERYCSNALLGGGLAAAAKRGSKAQRGPLGGGCVPAVTTPHIIVHSFSMAVHLCPFLSGATAA